MTGVFVAFAAIPWSLVFSAEVNSLRLSASVTRSFKSLPLLADNADVDDELDRLFTTTTFVAPAAMPANFVFSAEVNTSPACAPPSEIMSMTDFASSMPLIGSFETSALLTPTTSCNCYDGELGNLILVFLISITFILIKFYSSHSKNHKLT